MSSEAYEGESRLKPISEVARAIEAMPIGDFVMLMVELSKQDQIPVSRIVEQEKQNAKPGKL